MYIWFWELLKLASTFSKVRKIYKRICLWTQCVVNSINYSIDCIFMKDNLYPKEILEFFCTNFLYRRHWCSIFLNNLLGFLLGLYMYSYETIVKMYCTSCWIVHAIASEHVKYYFKHHVEIILVCFPKKKKNSNVIWTNVASNVT